MEPLLLALIKAFILPPGVILLIAILGLLVYGRRPVLGGSLIVGSLLTLYILSIGSVSQPLAASLQIYPALPQVIKGSGGPKATVVLGAGRYDDAPEYGGDTVSADGLERLRYAVYLQRKTGLPILLTGGKLHGEDTSEARLMDDALREVYRVKAKWLEEESRNTRENATLSRKILKEAGVDHIYLVTHALHMRRAVEAFEAAGFQITPAPTIFATAAKPPHPLLDWLPSTGSLAQSRDALHEYVGRSWNLLRYWLASGFKKSPGSTAL